MLDTSINLQLLQEKARQRWLKSSEVLSVLKWANEKKDLSNLILQALPDRPFAGTIYLIDTRRASRKWKQDGHEYVKRKNGMGFKEDTETLKIGGIKEIVCYYSQIEQAGILHKSEQYPTHRRIYKLIKRDYEDEPSIFLVHYLYDIKTDAKSTDNDSLFSRNTTQVTGFPMTENSIKSDKQMSIEENDAQNSYSGFRQSLDSAVNQQEENFRFQDQFPYFNLSLDRPSTIVQERSEFNLGTAFQDQNTFTNAYFQPNSLSNQTSCPQAEKQQQSLDLILNSTYQENQNYQKDTFQDNSSETLSFENFYLMKNKIKELEERIHDLEREKSKMEVSSPLRENTVFELNQQQQVLPQQSIQENSNKTEDYASLKVSVIDFSPEWDFTKGGAKVIVCISPSFEISEAFNDNLTVDFGGIAVPARMIQPGVIKCYAPPHPQGLVKLAVLWNGTCISKPNTVNLFEFRKKQSDKKKKIGVGQGNNIERANELIRNDFKVRLIEKIHSIAFPDGINYLSNAGMSPTEGTLTGENQDSSDNSESENENIIFSPYRRKILSSMAHVAGSNLDNFGDETCFQKLSIAIDGYISTKSKIQLVELLNKYDDQGLGIIHYLVYLGFRKSCELILDQGVNACLVANGHMTPLEIALSLADEKMIELLIKKGALIDQNSKELLKEINEKAFESISIESLLSNSKIIDMLMREASLCDSLHNSTGGDSLSLRVNFDEGDELESDSYISISDLIENLKNLGVTQPNGKKGPVAQGKDNQKPSQRKRGRYLRNYDKKHAGEVNEKDNIKEQDAESGIAKAHAEHENHIQIIQKNVRGWLLRRQYLDTLHATRVLQSYIRKKYSKKSMADNYDEKIKNMVKDWLKIPN